MMLLFLLIFCLAGCSFFPAASEVEEDGVKALNVAVWNIQALFDGKDNGFEYAEYLVSAGWSPEKYRARLTALVQAVGEMSARGPDVLALVEVENGDVLEDLIRESGDRFGYRYSYFANNPGASLGLGLVSRYQLDGIKAHSVISDGSVTPRPVLEARLELGGRPLILMICHFKSKLGDEAATELLRRSSARVLVRRLREIETEAPGTPVVILGDLNENHDEFYRNSGNMISALMPDDAGAAFFVGEAPQEDFLVLSKQKPPAPRAFPEGTVTVYSPWGEELKSGSYAYQNAWETIDHALFSPAFFDAKSWEFFSCEVLHEEPFTRASGYPASYNPASGSGLSDHLPLTITLKLVEEEG
jgi:endonuclease/exonuclease/phosphatase family metal-dependent hydrolase